jgi:hypothetical protein
MNRDISLNIGPYLVPLLVIALVALRLIRNKPRKVKPNRLFILPGFLTLATAFTLAQTPAPGFLWIGIYVVAAVLGGLVGYLSARHRQFTTDAESGEIMSRATPIGTIIFAALFAVRFGLKLAFPQLNGGHSPYVPPPMNFHPAASVIGWTDAGLVFSTILLLSTAATTWWRTRRLVADRPAKTQSIGGGPPPGLT